MMERKKGLLLFGLKLFLTLAILGSLFLSDSVRVEEVLDQARALRIGALFPWLVAAVLVKILGILGNVLRWKLLLQAQDLHLSFSFLLSSFLIGRFVGIATPGTLGLDGYRLVDSIQKTEAPWRCTAVLAADKVAGMAGLLLASALVFPLGHAQLGDGLPFGWAPATGLLALIAVGLLSLLLAPQGMNWVLKRLPNFIGSDRLDRLRTAAQGFAGRPGPLGAAVLLALFGHLTTAAMYYALLGGLMAGGPSPEAAPAAAPVLLAALLMTVATLVVPTLGGEGLREWVFVALLAPGVPSSTAFLFGHLGFWVEKGLLGFPGGVILWLRGKSRPVLGPDTMGPPSPTEPGALYKEQDL